MPQPLPANPYDPNAQAPLYEGYAQCAMMETEAGGNGKNLMLARCLGYLILELPHDAGELVAFEVLDCSADFCKMKTLSHLYIDHLIRLCESSFVFNHYSSLIHFQSDKTKEKPLHRPTIRVALRLSCTAVFLVKRWIRRPGVIMLPKDL